MCQSHAGRLSSQRLVTCTCLFHHVELIRICAFRYPDEHCISLVQQYGVATPLARITIDKCALQLQGPKTGTRPGETTQILYGVISLLRHLSIPRECLSTLIRECSKDHTTHTTTSRSHQQTSTRRHWYRRSGFKLAPLGARCRWASTKRSGRPVEASRRSKR